MVAPQGGAVGVRPGPSPMVSMSVRSRWARPPLDGHATPCGRPARRCPRRWGTSRRPPATTGAWPTRRGTRRRCFAGGQRDGLQLHAATAAGHAAHRMDEDDRNLPQGHQVEAQPRCSNPLMADSTPDALVAPPRTTPLPLPAGPPSRVAPTSEGRSGRAGCPAACDWQDCGIPGRSCRRAIPDTTPALPAPAVPPRRRPHPGTQSDDRRMN